MRRLPFLLAAFACHAPEPAVPPIATYEVYAGADLVLTVRAEPGPLTSTAPPPPDGHVPSHPFLSAGAHDAASESQLRAILDQSTDVEDFLARLTAAGFRVERLGAMP